MIKNIIRSILSDQYHVYVILFIIDKPMRVLVEQENVKEDIVSVNAMTNDKHCPTCECDDKEYKPKHCPCCNARVWCQECTTEI